ncbi:MAG: ABC transporter ATP-binding protein/permease [Firmicutes bacterium]|nr:ABC transporter ATP-binding protein/permease [Bacillota bacterium]
MLRLERVSKFYSAGGMVSAGFSKVDLEFQLGEFVAITGESGSGKSTLLNVISGLDSFEEGEMYIQGQPTSGYSKEDLENYRKQYIGSIFQTFNLINSYTVYQNVELVLLLSGYDKKEIPDRVHQIIDKVGLSGFEKKKASKLSGGQKQRVAIARALAKETPVIVADEPTGNLDSQSAAEIIQLLHELSKDKLIIIVTHNYEQVEPYVTRKITMHDGRVAEDKQLKAEDLLPAVELKAAKADELTFGSQLRLGLRNTFNIPAKFGLLLLVFLFLCFGAVFEYVSWQNMGDSMDDGWSEYFRYTGKDRILVTKEDKSEFRQKDYDKLAGISNVESVVENDITLDLMIGLAGADGDGNWWGSVFLSETARYADQVTEGRLPKNAKEAVLLVGQDSYAGDHLEEITKGKLELTDDYSGRSLLTHPVKVVGYGFLTEKQLENLRGNGSYSDGYLCMNDKAMDQIRMGNLVQYCTQEIHFADTIMEAGGRWGSYPIYSSEYVPEGQIYIPEDIAMASPYEAAGQDLRLVNKSLYFEDTYTYTVGAAYNKNNCYYYLGIENLDNVDSTAIYVSPKDYRKLFDKENFQSSVLVADEMLVYETEKAIKEAGYKTLVVNDAKISYNDDFEPVYDILILMLLIGGLLVLFFITYFIVKLILKSRNVYFSTIRMLGATKANCSSLLKIELFVVFNLAFFVSLATVLFLKQDTLGIDMLPLMMSYLETGDLMALYVILCAMTILLAARYARQLFSKTAMNAYKEEV